MNAIKKVAALLALMLMAGCIVEVDFEPIGGTGVVEGRWTVNGAVPTAASCAALGLDEVELRVYEQFGSDFYTDASLRADCVDGTFTTAPFLLANSYRFVWVGYDAAGAVLAESGDILRSVGSGATLTLENDFTDGGTTTFDPRGDATTLSGGWLINGVQANAALCAEAGIDTARLSILDATRTETFDIDFDCASGAFDGRTDTAIPALRADMFFTRWSAVAADGTVIAMMDMPLALNTTASAHAELAQPDFVVDVGFNPVGTEVTVDATWTLNGLTATRDLCDGAQIANVVLRLSPDAAQSESQEFIFTCMTGGFDSRTAMSPRLRAGNYFLQWLGTDSTNTPVQQSAVEPFNVAAGHASLGNVDFQIRNDLDLGLAYEQTPGGMDYGTCADAGLGTINYTLIRPGACTGTTNPCVNDFGIDGAYGCGGVSGACVGAVNVVSMVAAACEENLVFEDVEPGEYIFEVNGRSGSVDWGGVCDGLDVGIGLEEYDCFFDIK